jgi:hypothetical protein
VFQIFVEEEGRGEERRGEERRGEERRRTAYCKMLAQF